MSGAEFLELLSREAAAVEFEGPLVAARAAGASPERLAELEDAKILALRVRGLLERRRQREMELTGLYETAGDLAGLRDLDAVLRAIVHRARRLLNTDIAYMTLNDDERGDTYMRVTDGSVSAKFQVLRLPMGTGLGGLVAQTGTPYATANYMTDMRFQHKGDIDSGVSEEGLVAILGVPLRLGSRVIGVLYTANRSARPFAREEVALMVSLGAHASVAIDTARLITETRAALEELSAANAVIRAHSASVERAAAAHDRMTGLVLRGGGVEDVVAAVTEVLGGDLVVLDPDGRPVAAVGGLGELEPARVAEALSASRLEGRAVRRDGLWVAAVVAGADDLGALVLRPERELVDADQQILERAALVTALLTLFRRASSEAEGRVRGELLDDLLAEPVRDPAALRERARRLGVDLDAPHVLVAVRADTGPGQPRGRALSWAGTYASARTGLAAVRDGWVVLLLPGAEPGPAAQAVVRELTRVLGRPVTAGGGGPAGGSGTIGAAYAEAVRCASALISLGRTGEGAGSAELGFVGLLLGAVSDRDGGDVQQFVRHTIGAIVDYDTRRGTTLLATLEAYFGSGGSLARAAERLHVHVNTVTQRLERVGNLLGADWQTPARSLEIQLALRLHRLRNL
ncbi:helix-turn-helix domain-containing protein [Catellatospora sp. KI3]|uniref:helix-turn-helix domain-containing protein n=1 Tax=Catellatospora sp. KI3 TaxID=3041620 RepID=UPI002482B43D|nr:helix-turn-helix domain-containing protein [Catellatospora sp. KI3]MDI1465893.1 helix-turn-helix domain-containing protein [Catellatospora sp. KI3]